MRRLLRLGPCALLLTLAGCLPGSEPAFDNDPLFGGPRRPPNGPAAPPPSKTTWNPTAAPSAPAGPAALASGAPAADASTLRIAPPPGALTASPHDADPWHSSTPPAPAGASLQQPQPLTGPPPQPVVAPPVAGNPTPAPTAPAAAPDPYGQLQDELARRGVLFQSLEGPDDQGVWRFSCGVPKPGDPAAVHRIEVSAAGDHGLAAVRAAIEQIDKDQRSGP